MNEAELWLTFAREDLTMAELAFEREIFRQTCFHSHQAVEKAFKGLLSSRIGTHPKGHSLESLLLFDGQIHQELADTRDALRNLDRFYIPTRYPDALPGTLESGEPDRPDAEGALRDARRVVAVVEHKMRSST